MDQQTHGPTELALLSLIIWRLKIITMALQYKNAPGSLVGRNWDDENENGNECKGVKMESRGKLDNNRKVKFVGPKKSVKLKEKTCLPPYIWKL